MLLSYMCDEKCTINRIAGTQDLVAVLFELFRKSKTLRSQDSNDI